MSAAEIIRRLEASYRCPCRFDTLNGPTRCPGTVRMTLVDDRPTFVYGCDNCGTQWDQNGQPVEQGARP